MTLRLLAGLLISLLSSVSWSQGLPATSIAASVEQITGNWVLLPLPDTMQPKVMPANLWPAECQWYSYKPEGSVKSQYKFRRPCDVLTSTQLDEYVADIPDVVSWKLITPPLGNTRLMLVSRSDVKNYGEVWEPRIALTTFTKDGVVFEKGDLIMYLVDVKQHRLLWIRHLRKLNG
jgi:hypothetical protein